MEVNVTNISAQLDQIVSSVGASPASKPEVAPTEAPQVSPQLQALEEARANGLEADFMNEQVDTLNGVAKELGVDVHFSIEVSDMGTYFVRVLDDKGQEVKTIPGEDIVQTREKIRESVKGLLEDSQS